MRDAGLLCRGAEHVGQRGCLYLVDNEEIGLGQQARRDRGIEGCRAVGKFHSACTGSRDKFISTIRFILKQRPVTLAGGVELRDGRLQIDVMIGPRIEQDLVLAVVGHADNGMAGGEAAVLNAADIDPGIAHLGAKPFILGTGRPDMAHIAAGAGQRN